MLKIKQTFFLIFILSQASFAQIYVSPTGSDSNPGTISQPLLSISIAMSKAAADTTIYLRGGTYNLSSTLGAGVSGSAGKYINLWAYPGESPVLDFSGEPYTGNGSPRGIELKKNYWYLKGLVIKNAADNGIYINGSYNIVENCQVSNNKDTGIQISSGGSYNYIHNCDSFGNNDPDTQGGNADGIDAKLDAGPGNVFRGCRVFDNSDDGYDCYETSYQVVFDSCWAFHNGYNLWGISGFTGNGNGFKLGGNYVPGPHVVTNCVSFDNVVKGFDQNNNTAGVALYNCTGYRNGTYNFSFPNAPSSGNGEDTLKNDLSFAGGWNASPTSGGDDKLNTGVVQSNNSWLSHTVSASDFLSLDTSLARVARLPDGTLSPTDFLRLAPSSGLVDAGIYVGLPYAGAAPDIGAFESGLGVSYLTSNQTGGGDWNSPSTWKNNIVPNDTSDVLIASGDSLIVTATQAAKCRNIVVQPDAKLNVSAPLSVSGAFSLQPNAFCYNSCSSLPSFPTAPSYYISSGSYYVHTKAAGNMLGGPGCDSTFGNVIVLRSGTTAGNDLLINGDLTVQTGDTGTFAGAGISDQAHLVHGNVYVNSGQWSAVDSNGTNGVTGIWNVDGNVTVGNPSVPNAASIETFSNVGTAGDRKGIINIGGDLNLISGARLQIGNDSNSTLTTETGIINLKGNFLMDKSADVATNSVGVFALNFVGNSSQSVTLSRPLFTASSSIQPVVFDTIGANSSLAFANDSTSWWVRTQGTFVVDGVLRLAAHDTLKGGQGFVLNGGGTLALASASGLALDGCIEAAGSGKFSKDANYVFNGSDPQVTGAELPDSVNNLTIVNGTGVTLTNPIYVKGRLSISVGQLVLNGKKAASASVVGGSSTAFVRTDSLGGALTISDVDSAMFPVGTSISYAPVWVTNKNSSDAFTVFAAIDSSLPKWQKGDGGRVNVRWNIGEAATGTPNCSLQFGWMGAEENAPFAANRGSDARIFLLANPDSDAGAGDYVWHLTPSVGQPYTVSRGEITELGAFGVGMFGITTGVKQSDGIPHEFALYQNYPNPFNPTTTVEFSVAEKNFTTLKVYNILGQEVATLFEGNAQPGKKYSTQFGAGSLSSGVYFNVLKSGGEMQVLKMLLLK